MEVISVMGAPNHPYPHSTRGAGDPLFFERKTTLNREIVLICSIYVHA
jgi:hypothetical protein